MISEMIADFFARFSIQVEKDTMEESMNSAQKSVEKVGLAANHVSDILKDLRRTIGLFLGAETISKVFEVNSDINNTLNQLVNATGSTEIAVQNLSALIEFADKSKMSIHRLAESFGPFQNQMMAMGVTSEKSLAIFERLQVAFSGAHINLFQAQLVQKDLSEFMNGSISLARLKSMEFGKQLAPVFIRLKEKLGSKNEKEAEEKIKHMTPQKRAELVASVAYQTYSKGQEEYEKSPLAALENVKNKWTELSLKIGESGFRDLAVQALNSLSSALTIIGYGINFISGLMGVMKKSFSEMPAVMWSVIGVLGAFTLALNANKIAIIASVAAEKMLIFYDSILAIMNGTVAVTEIIMTAPLWLIVAGVSAIIAAVALLVDDFYTYFHGGRSVVGLVTTALKNALDSFLVWFERIGAAISLWIQKKTSSWIGIIDQFGESLGQKLTRVFSKIKMSLISVLSDIKKYFFDLFILPIEKVLSKIEKLSGFSLSSAQEKINEVSPKLNNGLNLLNPELGEFALKRTSMSNSSSTHSSITNHSFAPSIHIQLSNTAGMDERRLASHISTQVENTLNKHYSLALLDATR